MVGLQLGEH